MLQELVNCGFLYINKYNQIYTRTRKRLENLIPYLLSNNRIWFFKDWLRQNTNIDPNAIVIAIITGV